VVARAYSEDVPSFFAEGCGWEVLFDVFEELESFCW